MEQRKPTVEEVVLEIQEGLSLLRNAIKQQAQIIQKQSEEIEELKKPKAEEING